MFLAALVLLLFYAAYILLFNTPMKTVKHDVMKHETMNLYSNLLDISIKSGMIASLQPTIQTATVAAERINDITDAEVKKISGDSVKSLKGDIVIDLFFSLRKPQLYIKRSVLNHSSGL